MRIIASVIFIISYVASAQSIKYPAFDFAKAAETMTKRCEKPVQYILENEIANCTGYLFSPEKEFEVRLINESYKHLKDYSTKQNELIDTMNSRIGNLKDYNSKLSAELESQKNLDFWKASLYFVLGVTVTAVISNNVER